MKRSEMIKALSDNFSHVYEIQIHAKTVIDFLESKGMLPPAHEKFVESGLKTAYTNKTLFSKEFVNEWEPEDETQ